MLKLLFVLAASVKAFVPVTPSVTGLTLKAMEQQKPQSFLYEEDDERMQRMQEMPPNTPAYDNPAMMVLDEVELAKQARDLDLLAARWQRIRDLKDWESSKLVGFSVEAEIINGRAAMFFLIVGLLTELWTGQNIPQQVATLGRILGIIEL